MLIKEFLAEFIPRLKEKDIRNNNRRYHAGQVGQQPCPQRVPRVFDAHAAEIECQDIQDGVRAGLEYARKPSYK